MQLLILILMLQMFGPSRGILSAVLSLKSILPQCQHSVTPPSMPWPHRITSQSLTVIWIQCCAGHWLSHDPQVTSHWSHHSGHHRSHNYSRLIWWVMSLISDWWDYSAAAWNTQINPIPWNLYRVHRINYIQLVLKLKNLLCSIININIIFNLCIQIQNLIEL